MNNIIPAVDKAVQILLQLSQMPASQLELSRELSITMSTTYRILMTLLHHAWIRKRADGRYVLAQGILPLTLGLPLEKALFDKAEKALSAISKQYQIACKLSIRDGNKQMTRFRVEPPGPVALTGQVKSTFPLIEGTVGAALLSNESPETLADLVDQCQEDIPEKQHPELLLQAIQEVKEHGIVLNLRKNRWNIAACSIPLHNGEGTIVAALTLIGSFEDFADSKRQFWETILKKTIKECEN